MKKKTSLILSLICVASFSLSSCSGGVSTLLYEADEITSIEIPGYYYYSTKLDEVTSSVKDFTYNTIDYLPYSEEDNSAFSPLNAYISLFDILGMSKEDSNTYSEIYKALNLDALTSSQDETTSEEESSEEESSDTEGVETGSDVVFSLSDDLAFLLDHLRFTQANAARRVTDNLSYSSALYISDSISYNEDALSSLASDYFISSYSTDFTSSGASSDITSYIKSETHKSSLPKYTYSSDTSLVLLNNLYVTANWVADGGNLKNDKKREFTSASGVTKKSKFLKGEYNLGRVVTTDKYSTFYTTTYDDHYYLKFIMPADGYSLKDIYNKEVISEVNSLSTDKYATNGYNATDSLLYENYYTRCLFPEFSVDSSMDLTSLYSELDVTSAFKEDNTDFAIVSEPITLEGIRQTNSFTLDKKGLDGFGSVSYELKWIDDSATGYTDIYYDYIIDKAFIYILTDTNDVPVYIGYVNNI